MAPPSKSAPPAALIAELESATAAIEADPASAGPKWGAVHKLMLKAKVPPADAARLIVSRDAKGLRALVHALRGGAPAVDAAASAAAPESPASAPVPDVDPATMKSAMRAFRRRLKVTRLDHESRLGVGPMTSGKAHEVDAILPPREFETDVWRALVASGKLRDVGRGFFALAEEADDRD